MKININELIEKSVNILKSKCELPDNGFLSGGALANTIYGLLHNVEVKFDDVDVFVLKDLVKDRNDLNFNNFFIQTNIKKRLVENPYMPYIREIGDYFFSIDNSKEDGILNTIEYYSNIDSPFFIEGFDLNCVQVSYDLKNKKCFYTKKFEDFLINKEIKISNLKTPNNTIIRYLKKCSDLNINPNKDTIDMVYAFLKYSNDIYVDPKYRNFREKTYNKFKLNSNILEKYFIVKERKYKSGNKYYQLILNDNAPVNKEKIYKISEYSKNIIDCYKFPNFYEKVINNEYLENIYKKLHIFIKDDYIDIDNAFDVDIMILQVLVKSNPNIVSNLSELKLSEQIKLVNLLFEKFYNNQIIAYTILHQNKFKNIELNDKQLKILSYKTLIKRQTINIKSLFNFFKNELHKNINKEQESYF